MSDILWKKDDFVFSYRVAGVCIQNGCVLLQKPTNDTAFAFPGGHVAFGETHAQTLIREFEEEMGMSISVGELMWVGELFFPWGERRCHQICLYYAVKPLDSAISATGMFMGQEHLSGRNFEMEFHWMPMEKLGRIEVYPIRTAELMARMGVTHFIHHETEVEQREIILE